MLDYHYCKAENCNVMIFNPKEKYCQHHEGQAIFDAMHGTKIKPKDKLNNFYQKIKNLIRRK